MAKLLVPVTSSIVHALSHSASTALAKESSSLLPAESQCCRHPRCMKCNFPHSHLPTSCQCACEYAFASLCEQINSWLDNRTFLANSRASYLKVLPLYLQIVHRKAFTPLCVSMCLRASDEFGLITSQIGHLYAPWPALVHACDGSWMFLHLRHFSLCDETTAVAATTWACSSLRFGQ